MKAARLTLQAAFAALVFAVLAVGVTGGARAFLLSMDSAVSGPDPVRTQAAYVR